MGVGWWVIVGPSIVVAALLIWVVTPILADRKPDIRRRSWLMPRRGHVSGGVHQGDPGSTTSTGTVIGERDGDAATPDRLSAQAHDHQGAPRPEQEQEQEQGTVSSFGRRHGA